MLSNWRHLSALLLAALIVTGTQAFGQTADGGKETKPLRVGVFDSRAVAVAYAHSNFNREKLKPLMEQHRRAKEAGDQETIKRLEAEGQAQQDRLHQQGFGTASVADLLEHIKDELPKIARENGVDLLVSKWDVAYQTPTAQTVDVTEAIIAPFHPNERVLKIVKDLPNWAPLAAEKLKNLRD